MSLKMRLFFSFLLTGFILATVGTVCFISFRKLDSSYSEVVKINVSKLKLLSIIESYVKESAISVMSLPGVANNKSKISDAKSEYSNWTNRYSEIIKTYEQISSTPAELEVQKKFEASWEKYIELSSKAFVIANENSDKSSNSILETFINDEVDTVRIELNEALMKLISQQNDLAEERSNQTESLKVFLNKIIFGSVIFGIILSMFLGYIVANWISNKFQKFSLILAQNSNELINSSKMLLGKSELLSKQVSSQAAAAQETVASMQEMTSMLAQSSNQTSLCIEISNKSQNESGVTQSTIAEMLMAVDDIMQSNKKLEEVMVTIENINTKTKVINDIVFKTQLLSFNASIEAARAGQHGRGFAVVAEEIGNLATMSGKAADEINSLLKNSSEEVGRIITDTQHKASLGKNISQKCESSFGVIGKTMLSINESIKTIVDATKEQEVGIKQTNIAMLEMDRVTTANAESADYLMNQSSGLMSIAEQLNIALYGIQEMVFGSTQKMSNEGPNEIEHDNEAEENKDEFNKDEVTLDHTHKAA